LQLSAAMAANTARPRAPSVLRVALLWAAVAACVLPRPARAEHGMPFLMPVPAPDTVIPTNAHIRLRSLNGIDWIFSQLALRTGRAHAALVSPHERVPLRVAHFFDDRDHGGPRGSEGGYGEGLLDLRPARILRPDTRYELELSYVTPDGSSERYVPWGWTTGTGADRSSPSFGGPARAVTFSADAADELMVEPGAPVITAALVADPLVTELVALLVPVGGGPALRVPFVFDRSASLPEGPTADYILAVARSAQPDTVEVGGRSLWCSTAYHADPAGRPGARYLVSLVAHDLAGHRVAAPGSPATITWHESLAVTACVPAPAP